MPFRPFLAAIVLRLIDSPFLHTRAGVASCPGDEMEKQKNAYAGDSKPADAVPAAASSQRKPSVFSRPSLSHVRLAVALQNVR